MDATLLIFPVGGAGNGTKAALLASVAFAPLSFNLAPRKQDGPRLGLLVTAGAGAEWDAVEMLAYEQQEARSDRGETAVNCSQGTEGRAFGKDPQSYSQFVLNAALGPRFVVSRHLALRLDARFLGGPIRGLDDQREEGIAPNASLGSLANQLTWRDRELRDRVACRTEFEGNFTVEFGVEVVPLAPVTLSTSLTIQPWNLGQPR